jgi:transposase-like protein
MRGKRKRKYNYGPTNKRGKPGPKPPTEEVKNRIIELLAAGNYRITAAGAVGISKKTLWSWLQIGKKAPSGWEHEFYTAVVKAEKQAEIAHVQLISEAAKTDARHSQWWLGHKLPKRWSESRRVVVEAAERVQKDLTKFLDRLEKALPADQFEAALGIAAKLDDDEEPKP